MRTPGVGRPLGFLAAWLEDDRWDSQRAHRDARMLGYNYAIRKAARERLKAVANADDLFIKELRLPEHVDSEPEDFD